MAKKNAKKGGAWKGYAAVGALWICYAILTFSQPRQQNADSPWHFTDTQILLLQLTIALPYLVVWLAAMHGARRFRLYSAAIGDGAQKKAFLAITKGLYWLGGSIVGSTLLGSLRQFFVQGHPLHVPVTIFVNSSYVVLPLIAFAYIFSGARQLLTEKPGSEPVVARAALSAALLAVSAVFVWLIFTNPYRLVPAGPQSPATYYLPDALILATVVLPAVVSWFLGTFAALYISVYIRRSAAVIYEKTLPYLSRGIAGLVIASIVLQILLSLGSERLLGLGLGGILAVIYVFLIVQGCGYVFIAIAADRLSRLQNILKKYERDATFGVLGQ